MARLRLRRHMSTAAEPFDAILDSDGTPRTGAPLGALLTAQARRSTMAPALTVGTETLSFGEFDARANARARHLRGFGLIADQRVVLALPNSRHFYEVAYALLKLGVSICHVSHRLTAPELRHVLLLACPAMVIGDVDVPAGVTRISSGMLGQSDADDSPLPLAWATHWKVATSGGSTGIPKLIVDPNPGLWGPDKEGRGRGAGQTIVNPAPLFHSAPFNNMLLALAQGSHVIDMAGFDAETYVELVERHRADWAYLVPTMMARIARLPAEVKAERRIRTLKTVVHMAAMCPQWVKQSWIDWLGPDAIWEVYGGAERIGTTVIGGRDWLRHRGSVGQAAAGSELAILDDENAACPVGEIGRIAFRTAPGAILSNYVGEYKSDPAGWFSYGDQGWLDADGYLYIADRRTDMIVTGGANVYPAEIELALSELPEIVSAVAVGLPDPDLGQHVHVVIQVQPDAYERLSEARILTALRGHLAPYKLPRSMEFTVSELRDDAGKVRRSAIREACLAARLNHAQASTSRRPPDSPNKASSRSAVPGEVLAKSE
jgi:bile acid-coenzyme A ligase